MICFACRGRLLATALRRAPPACRPPLQWQTKTNLSSASAGISESEQANDDYVPSIDVLEPENNTTTTCTPRRPSHNRYNVASSEPRFSALHRRRMMRRPGYDLREDNNNSLEMFEKVVRRQIDENDSAMSPAPKTPAAMAFYNDLAQLRPMMKKESIETCLEFFIEKVWVACPFEGRNRLLKQRGTFLMRRVIEAKMNDFDNERLPSIAQCMQIFHELDSLSSKKWADALMSLIINIDSRSKAKKDYENPEAHKKAMARKEELVHDLVDSWIVFHRHCLLPHRSTFRLPSIDGKRLNEFARQGEILKALGLIFPQLRQNDLKELPAVTIATFVVLADPHHTSLDIQEKARPLIKPLGTILATVPVWKQGLYSIFEEYPDVLKYVLQRWDTAVSQLRQTRTDEYKPLAAEIVTTTPVPTKRAGPSSVIIQNKVTAALKMSDVEAIEEAWRWFRGIDVEIDDVRRRELKGNQELFHYFIMAFTAFRRPQRSFDVWDCMVSIGIHPTLQTWTALIEGCRRSKNAFGLENVWKKLLATGAELDDAVWSARIAGLVDCRQPEAGVRALHEMMSLSRVKPGDPAVAKLTRKIISVNAAVAALLRLNAKSAAMEVLTWASQNGIEPNLATYNTLLRPMVQQGKVQQIDGLLKMMKEQGIQPDAATFTVLLDGLVGSTKDASPDEQVQMVNRLFSNMEAVGVEANMETFARIIHLLLCEPGANATAAVDAIRLFIRKKGLRLSPHIYTILVNHYFSQDPPDVGAVDVLLEDGGFILEDGSVQLQVLWHGRKGLDRVFWERVIKGYATAGDVDRAYMLFGRFGRLGSALTMDTLEILLRALVRAEKADEARELVGKVASHRQGLDGVGGGAGVTAEMDAGVQGRHWRHGFWGFAVDCGLVSLGALRRLELGMPVGVGGARETGGMEAG